MSTVTVLYATDCEGRVVHSTPGKWMNRHSFIITDHPFLERGVYSRNEINVNRKGIGSDFAGSKPILFVESLRDAIKEALERSGGSDIYVLGSDILTNKALKYAKHIIHTTYQVELQGYIDARLVMEAADEMLTAIKEARRTGTGLSPCQRLTGNWLLQFLQRHYDTIWRT